MTIPLSLFVTQVRNLIPDIPAGELSALDLQQHIKQAVRQYSLDAPDDKTLDLAGTGSRYYAVTGLTGWQDSFSQILSAQYPAPSIASNDTPQYLAPDDIIDDYYDGATRYLYFPNHSPAAGEAVRMRYTVPYVWTAGTNATAVTQAAHGFAAGDTVYLDTIWIKDASGLLATHAVGTNPPAGSFTALELETNIPEAHFFAVCHKAACNICYAIAAKYSRTSDSTISADSVNHTSRAEQFSARARELCKLYSATVGAGDGDKQGGKGHAEFVDWDTEPNYPQGRQFIFHGRENR